MPLHIFSDDYTRLQLVERTSFSAEGVLEVKHIQEALAADIEILEKGLMVISREYNQWAGSQKAIDILAIDQDGNLVVIELKRGTNDSTPDLQAIRYAGMVSVMSREDIVSTYQEYEKLQTEGEAEAVISAFLGGDIDEYSLGEQVRIFIVAQDFTDEVVATVLWLNSQGLDISCYTLSPYKHKNELLLFSQRLIPLREASDWQGKFAKKEKEVRVSSIKKDYTKYDVTIATQTYTQLPKGRAIHCIVKELVEKCGVSCAELESLIGKCPPNKLLEELIQDESGEYVFPYEDKHRRYYVKENEWIRTDGKVFVLTTQWSVKRFTPAISLLQEKYKDDFSCTATS